MASIKKKIVTLQWCKQWYNEYNSSIRIHDYFSIMINQFPLIVIRKYDDPHSQFDPKTYCIALLGLTLTIINNETY